MNKTSFAGSWQAKLKRFCERALDQPHATSLWQTYHSLFPEDYQSLLSPRYALNDILHLEDLTEPTELRVSLINPCVNHPHYRLHFYSLQERYLDEYIPVLENVHLRVIDQVQFSFPVSDGVGYIKSFTVEAPKSQCKSLRQLRSVLLDLIDAVLAKRVENDALNKLVVLTGLAWHEIDVLRAYRNYLLQLGHHTTRASIHHALISNPSVARDLFRYFEARFLPEPAWEDPMLREEAVLSELRILLLSRMAAVTHLNDDRILRTLFNLIDATVRSNYHQRRSSEDYFIAFKINSLGVIDMPAPRPMVEIYVHGVDMEGIHLRGGKISRGGIRWSDRPDDFRTEILGLMQTQISKNALIIPTGAKGGFVVKKNGSIQASKAAGKAAYITLMRGLLDLTDNYAHGTVVHPSGIVIHDEPDPYLVVAADKGTATFSDIANSVAVEYEFWLQDAFASGGSTGYDHKVLGITARGAWECVKRHFLELGKDIQHEAFTVIGIGSMDGDVFGNGMLLSPYIRLQAAFSGQHIFIDPSPMDSQEAFQERQRLFSLPGSTWNDYDRTLISKGGGVFERSAKDIPVTPEIKKWLGIRYSSIDGESLIRQLLMTSVELLWLGGIGTYVKASSEKDEDVGDRANDRVRVNACDLKANVVGEGANLGFTQKARIEFNLRGGRINTDAVDNSAGVDTSDHEVNLKIFLASLHKQQIIPDYQTQFVAMTDAVCELVLADNIAQSLCLSLEQQRCSMNSAEQLPVFLQVVERLESAGFLDRAVESFAQNKEIYARPGQVISRPELAVLMAASKMFLTHLLQNHAEVLQSAHFDAYLSAYFPAQCCATFKQLFSTHPLANEIKATVISNKLINQAGSSFLSLIDDNESDTQLDPLHSYLAYEQIIAADELRACIGDAVNPLPAELQYKLLLDVEQTLTTFCRWALNHQHCIRPDDELIKRYREALSELAREYRQSAGSLDSTWQQHLSRYQRLQLPAPLAEHLAVLAGLQHFPFLMQLKAETQLDFAAIQSLLNDIQRTFELDELQQSLLALPLRDYWERKISEDLQNDLYCFSGSLLKKMVELHCVNCKTFLDTHADNTRMASYWRIYEDLKNTSSKTLLPYVALVRALGKLLHP